ncbi:hypothetical protein XELAEV_18033491mg [Xenopus laevis]|uniref:Uncharacterized protein n=1 Tax=Xenopus laevis TaxID=8355 RepID=A0A974CKW5_XENLA|nr:hypothetical protein XELAEV_18033491mg [Xenopus laevis]
MVSSTSTSSSILEELPPNTIRKLDEAAREASDKQRPKERRLQFTASSPGQRRQPLRTGKRDNQQKR